TARVCFCGTVAMRISRTAFGRNGLAFRPVGPVLSAEAEGLGTPEPTHTGPEKALRPRMLERPLPGRNPLRCPTHGRPLGSEKRPYRPDEDRNGSQSLRHGPSLRLH